MYQKLNKKEAKMGLANFKFRKKRTCSMHSSFWLEPEMMNYIRSASKSTRISQGQLLQIIVDQYRLNRRRQHGAATAEDLERLEMLECFNRIIPV